MTAAALRLAYDSAEAVIPGARSEDWPDPSPLPSTLPDVPAFAAGMLPLELRAWVCDIADRMQCPIDFVAIPAMIAAGSLLGRKIGIRPQSRTDWTEVCNLWGVTVGNPGALKSPAIAEVLAPIRRLERDAAAANDAAIAEHLSALALHKLQKEAAEKLARKELQNGNDSAAAEIMKGVQEPPPPAHKRFMTSDATVEKLGEICADNPAGILVHRDELLTLFSDLDQEEKATARGFFLTGWGGRDSYTVDRITRGTIRIGSVNISLIGSTQPNRVAAYLRASFQNHDDGMAQRVQLLCWPDFSPNWKSVDEYLDLAAKESSFACFGRLANFDAAAAGAERDRFDDGTGIPFLRFAPDALGVFEEWRSNLESRIRSDELSHQFVGHLSKYRGLIPRLALIYHLASGCSGPVSLEACLAALAWDEYLEGHAARAYASISTANTDVAHAITKRIKKADLQNGFTERDVYHRGWSGLTDRGRVSSALKLLEDYDWLRSERRETGGRPSTVWWVNPAILP